MRNVRPWADRCTVVNAAVWSADGPLRLHAERGREFAAHVDRRGTIEVRGLSLDTLLAPYDAIDYLKVDIEGAEAEIFTRNTAWARKVRCLKVEAHPPYEPVGANRIFGGSAFGRPAIRSTTWP